MRYILRKFKYQVIHMALFAHVGFFSLVIAAFALYTGEAYSWLLLTVFSTYVLVIGVSVGMHRLFCHRSYKTTRPWEWFLGIAGTLAVLGSPAQWALIHSAHHRYSDSAWDPHVSHWTYLLWRRYNLKGLRRAGQVTMFRDDMHRFLHTYNLALILLTCLTLGLIDYRALLFGYLVPLGVIHTLGGIHQVISHGGGRPRNIPILEALLPTIFGEWYHRNHHDDPRAARFGRYDLGYLVIKLIQKH